MPAGVERAALRATYLANLAWAAREATSLKASLRKLEQLKARADGELKQADRKLAAIKIDPANTNQTTTDDIKAQVDELKQKAATKATDAATQLDAARTDVTAKLAAAAIAKDAAKAASAKKADAAKAATAAKLAAEPVSIYISRATRMLYVRRNTHKPWADGGEVFDASIEMPVTIRDPDLPIGTHVFTAAAQTGAGLRWTAVSIDDGDNAKNALDRITMPKEVLDRIAPTAVPRSSIIVSDEPLSSETNYRTEFVAVLSNQPQGGFITRQPTAPVNVASDGDDGFGSFFQPRGWDSPPAPMRRRGGQYYYRPAQPGWW